MSKIRDFFIDVLVYIFCVRCALWLDAITKRGVTPEMAKSIGKRYFEYAIKQSKDLSTKEYLKKYIISLKAFKAWFMTTGAWAA